ncbi:MAG: radical SAM protein [Magnetococcales bacterium]|nr:radical SAM protein [Magnetococcales bacterium]MBF0156450.1 radical SAM protein [Magnetococcales bacterium]
MDLLLIDPPWIVSNDRNLWKRVRSCLPSLGLAYLASYAEKYGHYGCRILDCTAEEVSVAGVAARLQAFKADPPRFIGITSTSPLIDNAIHIARLCKEQLPESRVILGGVHPSVDPDGVMQSPHVDAVVRGEGEVTVLELLNGREWKDILGLTWRDDAGVHHNPERPLIRDLSEIPIPAYHLLPIHRYRPAVGSFRRLPAMSLFATRGCPGRCTFCHRAFGGKVRKRNAADVFKEVEYLYLNHGIREICFYDDTFTVFKKEVAEFCRMLIDSKLDISWSCFSRVDRTDESLLRLMKQAGCHLMLFGVESADPEVLKNINKRISLDDVRETFRLCRQIGIDTRASLMFGNPGETRESIERTIRFAMEIDPDQAQFNITTAYRGTELYAWALENGYLVDEGRNDFNVSDINLNLPTISPRELQRAYRWAHVRFYLRPRVILRRLGKIRSREQLQAEVRGFLGILGSAF